MMKFILTLTFLLSFVSCSQQAGKSSAGFKVSMGAVAGAPANFQGGLMLYGRSPQANMTFGRVMNSDTIQELIPNGTWHFYAIGWDGPNAMEGKVYCGHLANVDLTGADVSLDLTVTNANCSNSIFSSQTNTTASIKSFPKLEIETCNTLGHISTSSDTCRYDPLSASPVATKGYVASYKVLLKSFDKKGTNVNVLNGTLESSRCGSVESSAVNGGLTTAGVSEMSNLNIPVGTALTPFYTIIRGYYGTNDCDSTSSSKGFKNIVLENGLSGNSINYKSYVYDSGGTWKVKLFSKVDEIDVCQGGRLLASGTPYKFAAGLGTRSHPYILCTAKQVNSIAQGYMNSSFKLGQDINMNTETRAYNNSTDAACAKDGDSTTPIGGYLTSEVTAFTAAGINCGTYSGVASHGDYTGIFDGNFKKITHLRIEKRDNEQIGFIRQMSGGALINTHFDKLAIEGKSRVGIVSSIQDSTTASIVSNITVTNSRVEADKDGNSEARIGFIVGDQTTSGPQTTIDLVKVDKSRINARGDYVGGVIGISNNLLISRSIVDSIISGEDQAGYVGGIIGKGVDTDLSRVGTKGQVEAKGTHLGGVAGYLGTAGSSVNDIYSQMLVTSDLQKTGAGGTGSKVYVGGLIGQYAAGTNGNYGYFSGRLTHRCEITSNHTSCKVGNIYGASTPTLSNFFSLKDDSDALYSPNNLGGSNGITTSGANNVTYTFMTGTGANDFGPIVNGTAAGQFNQSNSYWATMTPKKLPEFTFEANTFPDPCDNSANIATINAQKISGRGTAANPIIVCTRNQFLNIYTEPTLHYDLAENIHVKTMAPGVLIQNFSGTFNGKDKILFGAKIDNNGNSTDAGIFGSTTSTAVIKKLKVLLSEIMNYGSGSYGSGFVGSNAGTIDDVTVTGILSHTDNIAILAGFNSGTIQKSYSAGVVAGEYELGGFAVENSGTIKQSASFTEIYINAHGYNDIGGVVSSNNATGVIEEVKYDNKIKSMSDDRNSAVSGRVAGIAANNSGTVRDVLFGEEAFIGLLGQDTSAGYAKIAGIVATNQSGATVTRALGLGNIEIFGTLDTNHSSIVTTNSGTLSDSFFYKDPFKEFYTTTISGTAIASVTIAGSSSPYDMTITTGSIGFNTSGVNLETGDMIETSLNGNHNLAFVMNNPSLNMGSGLSVNTTFSGGTELIDISTSIPIGGGHDITFFKSTTHTVGGTSQKTDTELETFSTYCSDTLPGDASLHICQNGWDIIDPANNIGTQRMLDYYIEYLGGPAAQSLTPVWEIDDNDGLPRLFKVH